jgi:hypothetical protein
MQRLCRITIPGLVVKRDFTAARRRLLAAFPDIEEVIATTAPGTLLVLSSGPEDADAWRRSHRGRCAARSRGWPRNSSWV